MRISRRILLFFLGGSAYVTLEWLWRGRSHISMFFAGGTCFLLLGKLPKKMYLPLRGIVGAGIITIVELATGLLCNRNHQVWDYRRLPANFRGQICLPFSLLWAPLSLMATKLYSAINSFLELRANQK